jgi:hypothetical protein
MDKTLDLLKPVNRVRRNHALEHATLTILAGQGYPRLSGYSDLKGFWVIGDVPTDLLQTAANQALQRLAAGEGSLAIHPHCGTNYVASGIAAGTAAWLVMLGDNRKDKWSRLPFAVLFSTLAFIFSRPLGPWLQKNVTTLPRVGHLKIVEITLYQRGVPTLHRIKTVG